MANLERQYIIPLRKEWLKAPRFRRAKKGVKAVREFICQHFRVEMKDVKVGRWLNEEIWARGIKNPPHKVKVKAVKDDKNIVRVELFDLSDMQKKIDEKEDKRRSEINDKKKTEEAKKKAEEEKKKAEEEKAKKEAEALAKTEAEKISEKVKEKVEETEKKATDAQKINVAEEKLMKKEHGKEHHHKPNVNMPHNKAQSKHPVRQAMEK